MNTFNPTNSGILSHPGESSIYSTKTQSKKLIQKWWRKKLSDMLRRKKTKVLETGVDVFPAHKPTLLKLVNNFWRQCSPPVRSLNARSPKIGLPSLVLKDKSKAKDRATPVVATFSRPSKIYECRGCISNEPSGNYHHDRDTCPTAPLGSDATSRFELRNQYGGGYLNPLAGPSTQRAGFVHERAKSLISASEVPSPAYLPKLESTHKTGRVNKQTQDKKRADWWIFSCCAKSKKGCDCTAQGQGNLGRVEGEALISMRSEDSFVNITFGGSPVLGPVPSKIAGDYETVAFENEHNNTKAFEDEEMGISRPDNIVKRKTEAAEAGNAYCTSTSAPTLTPIPALDQAAALSRDMSIAQRLKVMKEKHHAADEAASRNTEDIWGCKRHVQGPGGILRGEDEIEDGFVEMEISASNIKDLKTSSTVVSGSGVRYLPLAIQDAMDTRLPEPTEEDFARARLGVITPGASSAGQASRATGSHPISPAGPALQNAARTGQYYVSSALSFSRTRSVPVKASASSTSTSTSTSTTTTAGPSRTLPSHIKKPDKVSELNEPFFLVRAQDLMDTGSFKIQPQDRTETGYPALDSSASSEDFGFKPTLLTMPGSWPDDSEWMEDKGEFEAARQEKASLTKMVKKR